MHTLQITLLASSLLAIFLQTTGGGAPPEPVVPKPVVKSADDKVRRELLANYAETSVLGSRSSSFAGEQLFQQ
jgi:hypothetical protein